MWKIWKEELRKVASRKIFWAGLALLLAFITFQLWTLQEEYSVTIGGQQFYGKEAIKRDQKLTSEYAGILTEEKGKQIYDQYGIYDDVEDLTCIVLAVSAMCRNSFLAVVVSLALYLFPLVYMEPQREMWVLRTGAAKGMIHFMMSMPVYLSLNWAYGFSGKTLAWHFLTALAAGAVCLAAGRRKYKDYQG